MRKIILDNLLNTRDLGGLKTKHGYKIKKKRIIRSGRLFESSKNDIKILKNKYNLNTIIDLRTLDEINEKPDPTIDGVTYNHIPIFENGLQGISKEKSDETSHIINLIKAMSNAKEKMIDLYPAMVSEKYAQNSFNSIFKILIYNTEGSTLYHCSAGKDRVGILTYLILSTLGVSYEDILEDYLLTNKYYYELMNEMMEIARNYNIPEDIVLQIPYTQGVIEEYLENAVKYINKHYGSTYNYISNAIGINDEDIIKLRSNYLEK